MAGLGGDIPGTKAVVSIEPSVPALPKPVGTTPPILAVLGQCDEQIPLADNRKEVRDLIAFAPKAPVVSVLLQHATHIDMVTGGGSHTIGPAMPDQSPACAPGALLKPDLQRAASVQLVGDFIEQTFGGMTTYRLGEVQGSTSAVEATSHVAAQVVPGGAPPAAVDPATVTYTRSTTAVLPPKPADMKLAPTGGDDI